MAANKNKQNIRVKKACERMERKRFYPTDRTERKLCKLQEEITQYYKDIDRTFEIMFSRGFRPNIDNRNPAFFKDFDFINDRFRLIEKQNKSIMRIEQKYGIKLETVLRNYYRMNQGRLSQSF